jgi:hypothetical protein
VQLEFSVSERTCRHTDPAFYLDILNECIQNRTLLYSTVSGGVEGMDSALTGDDSTKGQQVCRGNVLKMWN